MQYNPGTGLGIVDEVYSLTDTDSGSYAIADVTRRANAALEELVGEIINADGTFQYDDTNHTTLPRGTGNLVEGQQAYSFAAEYLQITMIEVKDKDGNWYKLKPLDQDELGDRSPDEYFGVTSGSPNTGGVEYFDQIADSVLLYPAPTSTHNTLTSGIRIWFKRTVDLFTTADTTQEPGLPSTHHVLIAYMVALPYNEIYHPERVVSQFKKIEQMKKTLLSHFAQREKAKRKIMRGKRIVFV